jgi:hypothetical protein
LRAFVSPHHADVHVVLWVIHPPSNLPLGNNESSKAFSEVYMQACAAVQCIMLQTETVQYRALWSSLLCILHTHVTGLPVECYMAKMDLNVFCFGAANLTAEDFRI